MRDARQTFGRIHTKVKAAKFVLDLIDYTSSCSIENKSVLDPGCGRGVFLLEALERSLTRALAQGIGAEEWAKNTKSLFVGYEIDPEFCRDARNRVYNLLSFKAGVNKSLARSVARRIVIQGDFLEWEPDLKYDVIVGNPPYVRYDNLELEYIRWLRDKYACFKGRADLCVPFIQHSLNLLAKKGKLAFICTNRFTLCDYGKHLRDSITKMYSITKMVDFTATKPFDTPVSAYPWLFVFEHMNPQNVLLSHVNNSDLADPSFSISTLKWREIDSNYFSSKPWRIPDASLMKLWNEVKEINSVKLGDPEFGVDIRVGLATGADKIFINPPIEYQIEPELLIPIVLSHSLSEDCQIRQTDTLLNTWDPNNPKEPIKLEDWPKASEYLWRNKEKLKSRYIAKKDPTRWYRLIDHPDPNLLKTEKLVFPSLRRSLDVYFDTGKCIPHHNCYYAIKKSQDGPSLTAIGALLSSSIMDDLSSVLAIKFNGRASRLLKSSFLEMPMPEPKLIVKHNKDLETVFLQNDTEGIDRMARELYGIA